MTSSTEQQHRDLPELAAQEGSRPATDDVAGQQNRDPLELTTLERNRRVASSTHVIGSTEQQRHDRPELAAQESRRPESRPATDDVAGQQSRDPLELTTLERNCRVASSTLVASSTEQRLRDQPAAQEGSRSESGARSTDDLTEMRHRGAAREQRHNSTLLCGDAGVLAGDESRVDFAAQQHGAPDLTLSGADRHLALLMTKWTNAHARLTRHSLLLESLLDGNDAEVVRAEMSRSDRLLQDVLDAAEAINEQPRASEEIARDTAAAEERTFRVKVAVCTFLKKQDGVRSRSASGASNASSRLSRSSRSGRSNRSAKSHSSEASVRNRASLAGLSAKLQTMKSNQHAEMERDRQIRKTELEAELAALSRKIAEVGARQSILDDEDEYNNPARGQ